MSRFLLFCFFYLKQKRSDSDASGESVSPGKLGTASWNQGNQKRNVPDYKLLWCIKPLLFAFGSVWFFPLKPYSGSDSRCWWQLIYSLRVWTCPPCYVTLWKAGFWKQSQVWILRVLIRYMSLPFAHRAQSVSDRTGDHMAGERFPPSLPLRTAWQLDGC